MTGYRCDKCPKGTYQNEHAQEVCKVCPIGKITLHLGSNSAVDCIPTCLKGKYMERGNQGQCLDCPVGTYQVSSFFFGFLRTILIIIIIIILIIIIIIIIILIIIIMTVC